MSIKGENTGNTCPTIISNIKILNIIRYNFLRKLKHVT